MQNSSADSRGVSSARMIRERLDSWKEVASFFRREVRTVQLWEKSEGLPVRRLYHKKLCSVYAYRGELEAWWATRSNLHTAAGEEPSQLDSGRPIGVLQIQENTASRVLLLPFEPVHSPLDKGPLREIVDKFAAGLRSDLIVELMRLRLPAVTPPLQQLRIPDHELADAMKQVREHFQAGLLLTGNIRYHTNHVVVAVQMIRASDSLCLWSERFDARLDNLLTAQVELARRIGIALANHQIQNHGQTPQNLISSQELAMRACKIGFHYWQRRSRSALMKALTYFEDAIEMEPECAEAYAGLADTYVSLSYNHLMPARLSAAKAREAVETAIRLDRTSVEVRNSHINLLIHCNWDLAAAERVCQEMMDAGTNDARTLQLYSCLMSLRCRHGEAVHLALHACRLRPDSDLLNGQAALAHFYAGDYGSALSFVRRTIDLQPQYLMGYALLGRTEAQLGNWDAAIAAFRRAQEISGHSSFTKALLAYGYAGSGDIVGANALLQEIEDDQDDCFPAYDVSAVHAILNQENEALQKMHKALGFRDMKVIFMPHDPRFSRLRSSAEFQRVATSVYSGQAPPLVNTRRL